MSCTVKVKKQEIREQRISFEVARDNFNTEAL